MANTTNRPSNGTGSQTQTAKQTQQNKQITELEIIDATAAQIITKLIMQARSKQHMPFIETLTSLIEPRFILHRSEFEFPEQKSFHLIIVIK